MSFEFLEDDEIPYKNDDFKRLQFYKEYGFTKQCLKDSDANIRDGAYQKFGYTEKAFNDESLYIRLKAYEKLGYTEKALKDSDKGIRLTAYQKFGYTEDALSDSDANIRKEARAFFAIQNIQNYKDDYDNDIVNKVVHYAKRIEDNHRIDNEVAHVDEDDMMYFIIENMHNLYGEDITVVQEIVKMVNSLPYSRWYA